jgi:hypothetical protein
MAPSSFALAFMAMTLQFGQVRIRPVEPHLNVWFQTLSVSREKIGPHKIRSPRP